MEGMRSSGRKYFILLLIILLIVLVFSITAVVLASKAINKNNNNKNKDETACYYSKDEPGYSTSFIHTLAKRQQGGSTVLIKNGTLWTGQDDGNGKVIVLENNDIYIEDGKISQIGVSLDVHAEITINTFGAFITPGIVDMHSHAGVGAYPTDAFGTGDINEATNPDTPQVRTIDAIDPNDPAIPLIREGGVTTSLILPGSANLIGGEAHHVKMKGGSVANMSIPGKVFADATALRTLQDQWDCVSFDNQSIINNIVMILDDIEKEAAKAKQPSTRPYDARLEPLVAILRNQAIVNIHCYMVQDFEAILRVADEFGFKVGAFHHALEAYKIPSIIAERNITIATFSDRWGIKMETYDASVNSPSILVQHGVKVALKSDHSVINAKHLIFEAVKAHHYGLSVDDSLRSITVVPANAIGLGDKVGSLAQGKDADVVLWDNHPLAIGSKPTQVLIEGVPYLPLVDYPSPSISPPTFSSSVLQITPTFNCNKGQNLSTYAVQGSTLWTMNGLTPIVNPTIIVEDGIITCAGECAIPAGVTTIQLNGGVIIPGIISATSEVGLSEVDQESEAQDGHVDEEDANDIHAADGIRLGAKHVWAAWAGGVTTQIAKPQGTSLIAGVSASFYTHGRIARDAVYNRELALHITIGNDAKNGGYTSSVSGQFAALRNIFAAAQVSGDTDAAVNRVLNGTLPVVFHVNQADEIGSVLGFKEEFELTNVIILGGAEAALIADQIAQADVAVILAPAMAFPALFENARATDDDYAILVNAGVVTAIAEFEAGWVRNIRWFAGHTFNKLRVKYNIPYTTLLSSITSTLAQVFNLPLGVGTITTGTKANFVLYDGDPLLTGSKVALVTLGGYLQCYPQQL